MTILQRVAELLMEAKQVDKLAKTTIGIRKEFFYSRKIDKISVAVELDRDGWFVDEYDNIAKVAGITYRGSWWFHVPMYELTPKAIEILATKEVHHWRGRE